MLFTARIFQISYLILSSCPLGRFSNNFCDSFKSYNTGDQTSKGKETEDGTKVTFMTMSKQNTCVNTALPGPAGNEAS